jgi:HD-like signal output (HDOD) protein
MPQAVADVIQHLSDLPPFPKVTSKLLLVLKDPSVSVDYLASLISSDPSLVMKVIHLSNSPFYMTSRPIENVHDAVFVLGINTIKSITTAVSIQKGLSNLKPRPDIFSMDQFWKHSYATAIVASKLGSRRGAQLADRMYLSGLVHDIGKMIQACFWPEAWKSAINYLKAEPGVFENVEGHLFGQTHANIAATLCRNWRFPTDIVDALEAMGCKESKPEAEEDGQALLIASAVASAAGFAFPQEESYDAASAIVAPYADYAGMLAGEVRYQLDMLGD